MHNNSCSSCGNKSTDWGLFILRIITGIIFLLHGYGKLFGDAPGIEAFTGMLTGIGVPAPVFFAYLVGIIEFVGGIALILGFWIKIFTPLLAVVMAVAFFSVKKGLPAGDVDLALFGSMVALALSGAGKFALARTKSKNKDKENEKKDEPEKQPDTQKEHPQEAMHDEHKDEVPVEIKQE